MDKNLISVNIVAYNSEKTLSKTIESVLSQKEVVFEIVFVNDYSTDSTLQIIETFKKNNPQINFTIISNSQNLGITKSRNIGLSNSVGNFIAVIDSDDVWIKDTKLKEQLDFLIQNTDHIMVGTQINLIDTVGNILKSSQYKIEDKKIKNKILILNQFAQSSVLIRKINFKYDESFSIWEDYDLFLKLGIKNKLANINEIMVNYLYAPKKYSLEKNIKNTSTEMQIIKRYKKYYPNFLIGYGKGIVKYILFYLHLK